MRIAPQNGGHFVQQCTCLSKLHTVYPCGLGMLCKVEVSTVFSAMLNNPTPVAVICSSTANERFLNTLTYVQSEGKVLSILVNRKVS